MTTSMGMTTGIARCAGLTIAAALAAGLVATAAQAQTTLRMNTWLPPGHSQLVGTMQPWAASVEKATEGRVKVELTDASLGAPPRQYDLAVDGIADVTFGVTGYTPGRFKLPGVAELPFVAEKGEALSVALWRTYEKYFEQADEFKGVQLLAIYAHGSGTMMTTGKPIRSLADYQGMKFRTGGGIVNEINPALGGVNVAAPANEVYEILSQGVADGTLLPSEAFDSFKLNGVIKYQTSVPGGFYSSVWFAVMNKDKFDGLPKEDQDAIMKVSGETLARLGGRTFDEYDTKAIETMKTAGVERITADDAFVKEIAEKVAPLEDKWVADAKALGIDGAAALQMMRDEAKAYTPGG